MQQSDYPSPVVELAYPLAGHEHRISIPRNEVFRIQDIFETQDYHIPPQLISSGPLTIVDIGANVGLFALYLKSIRPDSDIHCFEPVPQTLSLLQKNTSHQDRIAIYPYALSNRTGMDSIGLHATNFGENSLKYDSARIGRTVDVQVMDAHAALSHIGLGYIDILKIDTEGSEPEILESLQPHLPFVGIIMAEYHSEKDRRRIDVLTQSHALFEATVCPAQSGLGIVKYINSRLV